MSVKVGFGPARRVPNAWSMVKAWLVLKKVPSSLRDGDGDGVKLRLMVAIFCSGTLTRMRNYFD